jgi:hypothetical protein
MKTKTYAFTGKYRGITYIMTIKDNENVFVVDNSDILQKPGHTQDIGYRNHLIKRGAIFLYKQGFMPSRIPPKQQSWERLYEEFRRIRQRVIIHLADYTQRKSEGRNPKNSIYTRLMIQCHMRLGVMKQLRIGNPEEIVEEIQ